jgi:hypothetical protein
MGGRVSHGARNSIIEKKPPPTYEPGQNTLDVRTFVLYNVVDISCSAG